MSIKRILNSKKFKKIIRSLSSITDYRMKGKIKHPIEGCLTIIILAMMSGCNYFREYVEFAKRHKNILKKMGLVPNGIPSHDTLERLVHHINKDELDKTLLNIIYPTIQDRPIIAIDGKNIRATRDTINKGTYQGMIDVLTAYLTNSKVSLVSESKSDKGNEMTVIPILIDKIHNMFPSINPIITIDAIALTTDIVSKLNEYNYDFVIAYKRSEEVINELTKVCINGDVKIVVSKNSSRVEQRKFSLHKKDDIVGIETWYDSISFVGRMDKMVTNIRTNSSNKCTAFFLTSNITLEEFTAVRRSHWLIENSLHYVLDNSFKEDRMRMKKGSSHHNMNLLRKFVLNIISINNSEQKAVSSIRDSMRYCSPQEILYQIFKAMV